MNTDAQDTIPLNETVISMKATEADEKRSKEMESRGELDFCSNLLVGLTYFLVILTFPLSLFFTVNIVREYERAVIMRMGRMRSGGAQGPGLFFVLPCIDTATKIDLRIDARDVDPQEILTKDSVTVTVDAVVYLRVFDPVMSVTKVEFPKYSTMLLASTTLRNVLGTKTLQEILRDRDNIAKMLKVSKKLSHFLILNANFFPKYELDEATDKWGIKVERVELKNVSLPQSMQRSMATEAEATRDAKAKVISAEGEQKASIALKAAADIVSSNPITLQLRYLQTLNDISAEKNSTIIFPIPIEMLGSFQKNEEKAQ